ncbi:UxaA family hydrolase [Bacillus piscicola]|uniref:UxaA family hydrolase n=1 Tax=Bacillus piscicola TaxID=1632684 RepID=UPI001F08FDE4|nr:UxaA family hydrolase [Bacillus piscicola]
MSYRFLGYQRENGQVGIRNHVAVISAMDNCNAIVNKIATQVHHCLPITVWYGRTGFHDQTESPHLDALVGLSCNPNIHSVLVVSLEEESAKMLCKKVTENTGKTATYIAVQNEGNSILAVAKGTEAAAQLVSEATEQSPSEFDLSHLTVGVECGGSDTTSGLSSNPALGRISDLVIKHGGKVILSETSEILGAEQVLAERAVSNEVKEKLLSIVKKVDEESKSLGINLSEINPSPDNKAGGLTTLEEKSLGAIIKGGTSPLVEVLDYAETPTKSGFYVMDTPSPACESITALSAGGAQIILFATGKGNIIGAPVSPTIKVTGNPNTAVTLGPNIDYDVSDVFLGKKTFDEIEEPFMDFIMKVASGKKTKSEILGEEEVVIKPSPLSI